MRLLAFLMAITLNLLATAHELNVKPGCYQNEGFTSVFVDITLKIQKDAFRHLLHINCNRASDNCQGIIFDVPPNQGKSDLTAKDIYVMQNLKLTRRDSDRLVLDWGVNHFVVNLTNQIVTWQQDDGANGVTSCR